MVGDASKSRAYYTHRNRCVCVCVCVGWKKRRRSAFVRSSPRFFFLFLPTSTSFSYSPFSCFVGGVVGWWGVVKRSIFNTQHTQLSNNNNRRWVVRLYATRYLKGAYLKFTNGLDYLLLSSTNPTKKISPYTEGDDGDWRREKNQNESEFFFNTHSPRVAS